MGHGLHGSYLTENLVSFYQRIITGTEIPSFHWSVSQDTIYAEVNPDNDYQISLWEAVNTEGRDFRSYVIGEEAWRREALEIRQSGLYAIPITLPEIGYKGSLVEVVFNPESEFPLTLTSGTLVTPDTYPFDPFQPGLPAK